MAPTTGAVRVRMIVTPESGEPETVIASSAER
jgi:hypothetical protein